MSMLSESRWIFLQQLQAVDEQHGGYLLEGLRAATQGSAPPSLHGPRAENDELVQWARAWMLDEPWCLTALAYSLRVWATVSETGIRRPPDAEWEDAEVQAPLSTKHGRWLALWIVRAMSPRQIAALPGSDSTFPEVVAGIEKALETLGFSSAVRRRWVAEQALHRALEDRAEVVRQALEAAEAERPLPLPAPGSASPMDLRIRRWCGRNYVFDAERRPADLPLLMRGDEPYLVSQKSWPEPG